MDDNDPTQQGGPEFTPGHATREAMMEEIANRGAPPADEAIEKAAKPEPVTEVVEPVEDDEPEQAAEGEEEAPQAEEEPEAPRMVQIVVHGQTIEVAEDKILEAGKRTLQKESAADKRLQEAERIRRDALALMDRARGVAQGEPSQDAHANEAQEPATREHNPAALDVLLEQKLYMRDAQKAANKFRTDFADIAGDPYLMQIAANLEQERLDHATAVGAPFGDPDDAYRKHGESIRQWLKGQRPATVAAPSTDRQALAERKRSITTVTAANARARPSAPARQPTTSEIIEAERVARQRGRQLPTFQRT